MQIDLIITTYNRPENVVKLCEEAKNCKPCPNKIIIVDSSEISNIYLQHDDNITYIKSSHKNQPYQRYLGSCFSTSDVICYFDDDITILDLQIFEKIKLIYFENINVVAVGTKVKYDDNQQKHRSKFFKIVSLLTGVPLSKSGEVNIFGQENHFSANNTTNVEVLNGPIMSFRKSIIEELYPSNLLSIFEKRWAMGEDKFISFTASRIGLVYKINNFLVGHPPNKSTYFSNAKDFEARVIYSRLWLAKFIGKSKNHNNILIHLMFGYYLFWRLLITGFNSILLNKIQFEKFKGNLLGLKRIIRYGFNSQKLTPGIEWNKEIENDIRKNKI